MYVVYKKNKQTADSDIDHLGDKDGHSAADPKTLDYFHKELSPAKEGVAIMELEMADIGSVSHNTNAKGKEEDGFSEYVQSNVRKAIMEPEIVSESHEEENFSPTPIASVKEAYKTKESIEV